MLDPDFLPLTYSCIYIQHLQTPLHTRTPLNTPHTTPAHTTAPHTTAPHDIAHYAITYLVGSGVWREGTWTGSALDQSSVEDRPPVANRLF